MRGLAVAWIVLAGLVWGCTQTQQDEARSMCNVLCDCMAPPLPSERRDCNTKCVSQFSTTSLTDACTECVFEHANRCATLNEDCTPLCQQPQPGGNG